MVNKVVLLMLL